MFYKAYLRKNRLYRIENKGYMARSSILVTFETGNPKLCRDPFSVVYVHSLEPVFSGGSFSELCFIFFLMLGIVLHNFFGTCFTFLGPSARGV